MSYVSALVLWLVSAMTGWVPVSQHSIHHETTEETSDRYESMATDAMKVAFEPSETPLFPDKNGRTRTALLMIAIAKWESGYIKRIDDGICLKGECDGGLAACIMQVHTNGSLVLDSPFHPGEYSFAFQRTKEWREEHKAEILNKDSLIKDRKMCFRAALHMLRESFRICKYMPVEDRMGIYTGEGCKFEDGKPIPNPKSRTRVMTAVTFFGRHAPVFTDEQVLTEMAGGPLLTMLP